MAAGLIDSGKKRAASHGAGATTRGVRPVATANRLTGMNPRLKSFFVGVLVTAVFALAATWGINERWQREAYEHYAGYYTFNIRHPSLTTFHWYR